MINKRNDFIDVLEAVKLTVEKNTNSLEHKGVKVEILVDTIDCYRAIVETDSYIGEIIVEQNIFSPHRFVRFEVYSIFDEDSNPRFLWYDSKENDLSDVVFNIEKGFGIF